MAAVEFKLQGMNSFVGRVPYQGSELLVQVRLTDEQLPLAESITGNISRRIIRPSVQEMRLQELNIAPDKARELKGIVIDGKRGGKFRFYNNGLAQYSLESAKGWRGNKTAGVLSGGSAKAIAHVGGLKAAKERGMNFDYIAATSGGSIIGGLAVRLKDVNKLKAVIYQVIQKYTTLSLLDVDFSDGRFSGLMHGKKLFSVIKSESGLGDAKFSELDQVVIIPITDYDRGQGFICADKDRLQGAFIEELKTLVKQKRLGGFVDKKDLPPIFPEDTVAIAMRESSGIPGAFKPVPVERDGMAYDMCDGGVMENCPVRIAANLIDVGYIMGFDLGYAGELEGRFSQKNLFTALFHTYDMMGSVQKRDLNDPVMQEVAVRIINFGQFNVGSIEAYDRAQEVLISAEQTTKYIIDTICRGQKYDPRIFFSRWRDSQIAPFGDRITINRWGADPANSNVYYMYDWRPLIRNMSDPAWAELIRQDGGRVTAKQAKLLERSIFKAKVAAGLGVGLSRAGWNWITH